MCQKDMLVEFCLAFYLRKPRKETPNLKVLTWKVAEIEAELLNELHKKIYTDFIRINW